MGIGFLDYWAVRIYRTRIGRQMSSAAGTIFRESDPCSQVPLYAYYLMDSTRAEASRGGSKAERHRPAFRMRFVGALYRYCLSAIPGLGCMAANATIRDGLVGQMGGGRMDRFCQLWKVARLNPLEIGGQAIAYGSEKARIKKANGKVGAYELAWPVLFFVSVLGLWGLGGSYPNRLLGGLVLLYAAIGGLSRRWVMSLVGIRMILKSLGLAY